MSFKVYTDYDLNQNKIVGLAPGVAATDAVNVSQLSAAVNGLDPKQSARAATTANITLSGLQTIDGVSLNAGDRVLVKSQTNAAQNGIYTASASAWNRTTDGVQDNLNAGAYLEVEEGSTLAGSLWLLLTPNPITIGTTALNWQQQNRPFTPVAGTGITVNGSTIAVDTSVVSRKVAATVGDGSSTSFVINHNLNTFDVSVQVYRNSGSTKLNALPDIDRPSVNSISVLFSSTYVPAANEFRVVITG